MLLEPSPEGFGSEFGGHRDGSLHNFVHTCFGVGVAAERGRVTRPTLEAQGSPLC